MILRRPNKRASTENAPGPSRMSSTSTVPAKITAVFESNKLGVHAGSRESMIATAPAPTKQPAMGVKKPTSKSAPDATASKPTSTLPPAAPARCR